MAILIFILILSFLVIIHELGHFLAARWSGIKVKEFGIGYPPKALKLFEWRGTDFTLNWIPFGGFVRMAGEDSDPSQRSLAKKGEFFAASKEKRLFVVLAGAAVNFVFGIVAFAIIFSILGIPLEITGARIGEVMPGSPAETAGVPAAVNIIAFEYEGQRFQTQSPSDVINFVTDHQGKNVKLVTSGPCDKLACAEIEQGFEVYLRSQAETPQGEGSLGVVFTQFEMVYYPWYEMPIRSMAFGLEQALVMGREILAALSRLGGSLISSGRVTEELAGPVGIVDQAQKSGIFEEGLLMILSFAGMLSINLAIMNILPIPPLDGGKALFTIFEAVIKPKYLFKIEYWMSYGGYLMLLALIVFITVRDVIRIFS